MSNLIAAASIYSNDAKTVTGSTNEPVPSAASGEVMDDNESKDTPAFSWVVLVGILVGLRVLWEVAG